MGCCASTPKNRIYPFACEQPHQHTNNVGQNVCVSTIHPEQDWTVVVPKGPTADHNEGRGVDLAALFAPNWTTMVPKEPEADHDVGRGVDLAAFFAPNWTTMVPLNN
jgi:hypothetical protein